LWIPAEDKPTGGSIGPRADYLDGERLLPEPMATGFADIDVKASIAFHEAAGA